MPIHKSKIKIADIGSELDIEGNPATILIDPLYQQKNMKGIAQEAPAKIFVAGMAEHLPLKSNSLKGVRANASIGVETNFEDTLPEVVRVLKSGGKARILTYGDEPEINKVKEILKELSVKNIQIKRTLIGESKKNNPDALTGTFIIYFTKL